MKQGKGYYNVKYTCTSSDRIRNQIGYLRQTPQIHPEITSIEKDDDF